MSGLRKTNAKGRTTGRRNRNSINEQFAARTISMLESPAFCVLSRAAHLCLARIEIEFARHGGSDNGRLPVRYADFEAYGVHKDSIAPALVELEALGFIEITERGRAGNAEWRKPNLFRLTFRSTDYAEPTNEWRKISSAEDAKAAKRQAEARRRARRKNKTPATVSGGEPTTGNHG